MRRVRWVGHPSPFDDQNIINLIMKRQLPGPMLKAFQRFEHNRRIAANPGKSEFSVGTLHGFSQTYRWLPFQEIDMEDKDFAKLMEHPLDRYMFVDVTTPRPPGRPPMTKSQWQELISAAEETPPPITMNPLALGLR